MGGRPTEEVLQPRAGDGLAGPAAAWCNGYFGYSIYVNREKLWTALACFSSPSLPPRARVHRVGAGLREVQCGSFLLAVNHGSMQYFPGFAVTGNAMAAR